MQSAPWAKTSTLIGECLQMKLFGGKALLHE
jgi:hypothetical protein